MGTGTGRCWFLCPGQEKKKGGGEGVRGRGVPALTGTSEYEQSTGIGSRRRVVWGVMEFGMSRRIKPKEKYVRISMKEIWRNLDGLPKNKELWSYVVSFEFSRPNVAQIWPSRCWVVSLGCPFEPWLEREIAQWVHHEGSNRWPIAPRANALITELHLAPCYMECLSLARIIVWQEKGAGWGKWDLFRYNTTTRFKWRKSESVGRKLAH